MSKHYLRRLGFGKYERFLCVPCSEKKARELKDKGFKVFNSREEADEFIRRQRN